MRLRSHACVVAAAVLLVACAIGGTDGEPTGDAASESSALDAVGADGTGDELHSGIDAHGPDATPDANGSDGGDGDGSAGDDGGAEAGDATIDAVADGPSADGGVCTTNNDCSLKEFCLTAPGMCGTTGKCTPIPMLCPNIVARVCGCNGVTYTNYCYAHIARESIAHQGHC
jgi:hypothetical protein